MKRWARMVFLRVERSVDSYGYHFALGAKGKKKDNENEKMTGKEKGKGGRKHRKKGEMEKKGKRNNS